MGSFSLPAKLIFTLLSLIFLLTQATPTPSDLDLSDYNALFHATKSLNYQISRSSNICNSAEFHCEDGISTTLRLTRIVLVSKQLTGSLSPQIGRLTELKELSLQDNDLVDRMPHQIVDCEQLEVLNLRHNRLSGQIPQEFASLVRLKTLDLSFNRFSGNLNFLKHFPNLETLYLSNNLFSGKIPVSLRNFRNLRFLNVSGNAGLQGSLPKLQQTEYSSSLPKRYIFAENVTRNNTNKSATLGVSPSPSPLPAPQKHKKSDHKNLKGWIIGFFTGLVAGIISGFIFSVLFKLVLTCIRGTVKESGPVIYSQLIKKAEDLAFLEEESGVASLEIIGRGGCGEVYRKAIYGDDGKIFAIKKINQPSGNGSDELSDEDTKLLSKKMRQVRSEINTVGEIRHRNLLPLLAHVPRPDCHYLVYEFMKNGSLHDMLKKVSEGDAELDWSVRHNIAIGVAAGLEYLHMHRSPRIIHRDLKPANILLDDDMEARIADFGLAAAMPDANTHVTTSIVAGTVGYIAPEYHQTLKFTDKCDVYSFGVVLAVLMMGKFPSDDFFQNTDEMSLVKWLRNVMMSDDPSRAIDRKLIGQGHDEQLLLVLKIAWFCTMDDPKQRPNSKDVHRMLTQVKH